MLSSLCQNSVLSHIPVEVVWLVLSANQETTQKRQRHPTSAVADAFACEINNAFTYCQVHLSPLGFHLLRIINQTPSFGPAPFQHALESAEWLTEALLARWWPTTPLLAGGEQRAKAIPNPNDPFKGGGRWLEGFPDPVKGPLCK